MGRKIKFAEGNFYRLSYSGNTQDHNTPNVNQASVLQTLVCFDKLSSSAAPSRSPYASISFLPSDGLWNPTCRPSGLQRGQESVSGRYFDINDSYAVAKNLPIASSDAVKGSGWRLFGRSKDRRQIEFLFAVKD